MYFATMTVDYSVQSNLCTTDSRETNFNKNNIHDMFFIASNTDLYSIDILYKYKLFDSELPELFALRMGDMRNQRNFRGTLL